MNTREIDGWVNLHPEYRADAVGHPVLRAYNDWYGRISAPAELHDLAPWSPTGLVLPQFAAGAAASAAGELAIVCMIWPGSIDAALRPVTPR